MKIGGEPSPLKFRGYGLTVRGRHGGVEKGGGWKTSRMTPLPKRGFGPPLVRYVFHPPQASTLCFSCTKIHDRADQKLFWRGPKSFGRARSLVRFPPPIRFAPPHITAQYRVFVLEKDKQKRRRNKKEKIAKTKKKCGTRCFFGVTGFELGHRVLYGR